MPPSQDGSRVGGSMAPNASMAAPQANASIAALPSGIYSHIAPAAAPGDDGPDDENIDDEIIADRLE